MGAELFTKLPKASEKHTEQSYFFNVISSEFCCLEGVAQFKLATNYFTQTHKLLKSPVHRNPKMGMQKLELALDICAQGVLAVALSLTLEMMSSLLPCPPDDTANQEVEKPSLVVSLCSPCPSSSGWRT